MEERTERPAHRVDGEASPIPPGLFWALWVGAFAAVLWGMLVLFGRKGRSRHPDDLP